MLLRLFLYNCLLCMHTMLLGRAVVSRESLREGVDNESGQFFQNGSLWRREG